MTIKVELKIVNDMPQKVPEHYVTKVYYSKDKTIDCIGSGPTKRDAKAAALRNAREVLKQIKEL